MISGNNNMGYIQYKKERPMEKRNDKLEIEGRYSPNKIIKHSKIGKTVHSMIGKTVGLI